MAVSLNDGTPKTPPKWSFLIGKPMVVGETHHLRNPSYMSQNTTCSVREPTSSLIAPSKQRSYLLVGRCCRLWCVSCFWSPFLTPDVQASTQPSRAQTTRWILHVPYTMGPLKPICWKVSRWRFQIFFYVHPDLGKISNLTSIFIKRVGSTTSQVFMVNNPVFFRWPLQAVHFSMEFWVVSHGSAQFWRESNRRNRIFPKLIQEKNIITPSDF